jgi:hypothetical protein
VIEQAVIALNRAVGAIGVEIAAAKVLAEEIKAEREVRLSDLGRGGTCFRRPRPIRSSQRS